MFSRFLLYTVVVYISWRFVRRLLAPARRRRVAETRPRRPAAMIRCETCGMFITKGSALLAGGREFCSPACVKQKARRA